MSGPGAPPMWLVILAGEYFYDHVSSHGVFAAPSADVALALAGAWAGRRYRRDLVIQEAQVYELTERQRKSWTEGVLSMGDLLKLHTQGPAAERARA